MTWLISEKPCIRLVLPKALDSRLGNHQFPLDELLQQIHQTVLVRNTPPLTLNQTKMRVKQELESYRKHLNLILQHICQVSNFNTLFSIKPSVFEVTGEKPKLTWMENWWWKPKTPPTKMVVQAWMAWSRPGCSIVWHRLHCQKATSVWPPASSKRQQLGWRHVGERTRSSWSPSRTRGWQCDL